jgi:hypothetical protein
VVVVLDLMLVGVAIGANPLALPTFLVLLGSRRGVLKGAAFLFGWLASLAAVVAGTLLLTQNHPPRPSTAPSVAALAFKIAAGVILVGIAVRQERRRGRPRPPKKEPKWQSHVDDMSIWFAIAIGFLIQPWGMVGIGVANVMEAKLASTATYFTLILYCVVASWSYITVELYAVFRPQRTAAMLDALGDWIRAHTDQLIVFASLGLGFWLIGQSSYYLATSQ